MAEHVSVDGNRGSVNGFEYRGKVVPFDVARYNGPGFVHVEPVQVHAGGLEALASQVHRMLNARETNYLGVPVCKPDYSLVRVNTGEYVVVSEAPFPDFAENGGFRVHAVVSPNGSTTSARVTVVGSEAVQSVVERRDNGFSLRPEVTSYARA